MPTFSTSTDVDYFYRSLLFLTSPQPRVTNSLHQPTSATTTTPSLITTIGQLNLDLTITPGVYGNKL